MVDLILIVLLVGIIGSIAFYLYRAKKQGTTCIGCPHGKQCCGKCCGEHTHSHHVEVK